LKPRAAPEIRFATAADVPALVALEQQSFPDPWPEDSLAQEVEGPGTLVLIAAESYSGTPLGYAAYLAMGGEAELLRRPPPPRRLRLRGLLP
jgi:ribosomal protein S18 acetylase RimI-like enzyme